MAIGYNTITFDASKCDGCGECMPACAKAKTGSADNLGQSRIQVYRGGNGEARMELALCRQCGDPKCVLNCPSTALTKNADTGIVEWDEDKCVNCLLCSVGCAYGGIVYNEAAGSVVKCDQCDGDPACVKACPTGALKFNQLAQIYKRMGDEEDLFAPGLSACLGCNSELMIRHSMRRIGRNSVVATPPGCIPGMGTVGYNGKTGTKVPVFHPLLTNTASMLAGIKRQYNRAGRDVQMVALAGDGGAGDVGFQSLSGAAERNEQILFICVDNEGYMNTGMQSSGCTPAGSWTSTTPVGERFQGKTTDSKNLAVIMMMHNSEYVATASLAYMEDFYDKLDKAIEASKRGFAYLHVYSPCPTGWRVTTGQTLEVCRKQVESNFVTLWEYTPASGLNFTRAVDNPVPLRSYIDLIGKYRHLDDGQVSHLQSRVDEQVNYLRKFDQGGRL